jgi:orotidine-5'-phosphate decarboxylase
MTAPQAPVTPVSPVERLIAALDSPTWEEACPHVQRLAPRVKLFKVGLTLFVREGRRAVEEVQALGGQVFLDLKLHDIPMQVAGAVENAARLGVRWVSVHTAGGERMLSDAREAALKAGGGTGLLGISVLTSLDQADLGAAGIDRPLSEVVAARARLAARAGIAGLVCSPQEIRLVRPLLNPGQVLVIPGIRLPETVAPARSGALQTERGGAWGAPVPPNPDDQKRVMGPIEALRAGADFLVMGRALVGAPDPMAVLARLEAEWNDQ